MLGLPADASLAGPQLAASAERIRSLNRKAGLYRWGGDARVYQQALERFAADHGHAATALAAQLAAGDWASALADCHRLRGVAANLGLERLAAALAALEQWCAAAPGPAAALEGAPLPPVREALQGALAVLRRTAPIADHADHAGPAGRAGAHSGNGAAGAPAGTLDARAALAAGTSLIQSLQRGALDDGALAALTASLAGHAGVELAQVERAVGDFDFPLAAGKLQTLLNQLAQEPT